VVLSRRTASSPRPPAELNPPEAGSWCYHLASRLSLGSLLGETCTLNTLWETLEWSGTCSKASKVKEKGSLSSDLVELFRLFLLIF